MTKLQIEKIFPNKTFADVLLFFVLHPQEEAILARIVRATDKALIQVQRALKRLVTSGLIRKSSQLIIRLFLCFEVGLYALCYVTGAHGMKKIHELWAENAAFAQTIKRLNNERECLRCEINDWQHYPWYREKIAREELQLAYPHDELFLRTKEKHV